MPDLCRPSTAVKVGSKPAPSKLNSVPTKIHMTLDRVPPDESEY